MKRTAFVLAVIPGALVIAVGLAVIFVGGVLYAIADAMLGDRRVPASRPVAPPIEPKKPSETHAMAELYRLLEGFDWRACNRIITPAWNRFIREPQEAETRELERTRLNTHLLAHAAGEKH